jgi:hypothetical protein
MKHCLIFLILLLAAANIATAQRPGLENPSIDMDGYLRVSSEAAKYRESRRLTEDEFIRMASEKDVLILDARSKEKYDELHVKGAVNLSFPDFTVESLNKLIPDKNKRILIYCNNNFEGAEQPFPTKIARASLNLSTYIALYSYGYRNIYELGPLLQLSRSKIIFESSVKDGSGASASRAPGRD